MKLWDVVIVGGGLAGLGLAKQLINQSPQLAIVVLEKNAFPRPPAIAKVGESTVEIGSHYLAERLQLKQHLQSQHLKKFGIRMFFGEDHSDFSQLDELGASQTFAIPTYQIDRGVIENHLAAEIQAAGVTLIDQATIQSVDLTPSDKRVHYSNAERELIELRSRWLIDAAGRAAFIKTQQTLAEPNAHSAHAVWFRVDKTIVIDEWSNDCDWKARCTPQDARWLSTNHLTGAGYWLWIIPLASGVTSIGIVMDDTAFEQSQIQDERSARQWLARHQPRCAEAIADARFLDCVVLNNYSYSCKQVFSSGGWAITGEAGVFADPFYSPGSDFIAIANDFICELVCEETNGQDIRLKCLIYEKLFQSIYQNTLSLYTDQYGGFGDRVMMGTKLLWDYAYYWGVLSLLYFRGALKNTDTIRNLSPLLQEAQALNQRMQTCFRQRANMRLVLPPKGGFMDQYQIPCLHHFNKRLASDEPSEIELDLKENIGMMQWVAKAIENMLSPLPSDSISAEEFSVLGNYRNSLNLNRDD